MAREQITIVEDNTGTDPLPEFPLYAILFTWFEGDIIEANLENLRTQGVDKVFVIDNDSPDDTREKATALGAEVSIYRSNNFIEGMKVKKVNDAVARIVADDPAEHVWMLYVDADELPTGPNGMTIRQYLENLDRKFRVVGSKWINHVPNLCMQNIPGFHPAEFQQYASYLGGVCVLDHNKHQLIRHDKGAHEIRVAHGFHWYDSNILHHEPNDYIWNHHFNYRQYETTSNRLQTLVETRMNQRDAFAKRYHNSEDAECFWRRRHNDLKSNYDKEMGGKIWRDLVSTPDIPKWYTEDELLAAVLGQLGETKTKFWQGERAFACREYDEAIAHLDVYLAECDDPNREITAQTYKAKCLLQTGGQMEAKALIGSILGAGPPIDVIRQLKPLLR